MAWFTRQKPSLEGDSLKESEKSVRTEGLWQKCESCGQIIWRKAVEEGLEVCPKCEHHFRIGAAERLKLLFDDGTFTPHDADLKSSDPLHFVDSKSYLKRLSDMRNSTQLPDAVICGSGLLNGRPVEICALELKFIGGSMGAVVGEKITRSIERCLSREESRRREQRDLVTQSPAQIGTHQNLTIFDIPAPNPCLRCAEQSDLPCFGHQ